MQPSEIKSLRDALVRHQLDLPEHVLIRLSSYCQLLWHWNTKLNLTRHTDHETFVARDVVDTVELGRLLRQNEEILDIGSGGGVPGVLLALLRPDLQVALCESVQKKARVLDAIVRELELPVAVHHDRAESVLQDLRFDTLVARAVGPLWKICTWFEPHWMSMDRLLLIKGPRWVEERKEARHRGLLNQLELRRVVSYPMPGTESLSVILQIWPKGRPDPAQGTPETDA